MYAKEPTTEPRKQKKWKINKNNVTGRHEVIAGTAW